MHTLQQNIRQEKCTFCGLMLFLKINACVSDRKVVCTAVVNRLEKSVDFHAVIRETFWFNSSAGLGVVQVIADKRLYATHHSFSFPEPRQIKPRAVGVILSTSKSRRLGYCNSGDVLDQKTTFTQSICRGLSFHDVWINFLGFIVGLISRCSSRRASVERSLCLKWLTMFFQRPAFPQFCS